MEGVLEIVVQGALRPTLSEKRRTQRKEEPLACARVWACTEWRGRSPEEGK